MCLTLVNGWRVQRRQIVADPNNSFLWIKFMAFQLSRTEVDKARVIAKRALKTISFRDEQEKLNIWYVPCVSRCKVVKPLLCV